MESKAKSNFGKSAIDMKPLGEKFGNKKVN